MDQLVMGAQLREPAVLHDGHAVRVAGGVQPVRDGDDGTALKYGRQGAKKTFYLSSAGFPDGVSGARFQKLVKTAASRWRHTCRY